MNIGIKPQVMAMVLMSSCPEKKLVLIRKMMLSISKLELWPCQLWKNFDNSWASFILKVYNVVYA